MLPSTFLTGPSDTNPGGTAWEPPVAVVLSGAAVFGGIAGAAFGWAQWRVLRLHADHAYLWIWTNAIGSAIGLPWELYLAGSLADVSRSVASMVVVGAIAGALMGLSVAVPTGLALRRMPPRLAVPNDHSFSSVAGATPSMRRNVRLMFAASENPAVCDASVSSSCES